MNRIKVLSSLFLAVALVGCGGGGGGGTEVAGAPPATPPSPPASAPAPTPPASAPAPTPPASTPLKVAASSYENKVGLNLPTQTLPTLPMYSPGVGESFTAGVAFGDFLRDGTVQMVGFSNVFAGHDGYGSTVAGKAHFYKKTATGWTDITSTLLKDTTGCISPRKVIVADFNGDGRPDVLVACHGVDAVIPDGYTAGEHPRILMSQSDGTYTNVDLGVNCYCHGAAAVDFTGQGYADVIFTDPIVSKQPFLMFNNHDGTFTKQTSVMSSSVTQNVNSAWNEPIYATEALDVNGDGNVDEVFGGEDGSATGANSVFQSMIVFSNSSGSGTGLSSLGTLIPTSPNTTMVQDMVMLNGQLNILRSNPQLTVYELQVIDPVSMTQVSIAPIQMGGTPWITVYNGKVVPLAN